MPAASGPGAKKALKESSEMTETLLQRVWTWLHETFPERQIYIRSDGRNVQGTDVPFAFDGGVTVTVDGASSVPFTLVRAQAKHEAPLKALAGHGGAQHISTVARVTFYGHDQTGRGVTVTGNIEVDFADWAG